MEQDLLAPKLMAVVIVVAILAFGRRHKKRGGAWATPRHGHSVNGRPGRPGVHGVLGQGRPPYGLQLDF